MMLLSEEPCLRCLVSKPAMAKSPLAGRRSRIGELKSRHLPANRTPVGPTSFGRCSITMISSRCDETIGKRRKKNFVINYHSNHRLRSRRVFLSDLGMGFTGLALGAMLHRDAFGGEAP